MTRATPITDAMLRRARAVMQAGDVVRLTSPSGIVIEITAGDGRPANDLPAQTPAQRAQNAFKKGALKKSA
jgi:hypothetical protein